MASVGSEKTGGILEVRDRSGGFLRDPERSYQPGPADVRVPQDLIVGNGLVEGAYVAGDARPGDRGWTLASVESVCGLSPAKFKDRARFEKLQAVNPSERIRLGDGGNLSMRIVDLIAPIGKGTRGLIVAPPKSGKTRLLEEIAAGIRAFEADARIIVLLIDERPEEVTHFRRSVDAEVLASSSDQSVESHIRLAEMALAHARVELECGRDTVVLIDSLTRMARAFNQRGGGTGRTLSGGLDSRALEIPRRFFGLARAVENGGSVTVIATAMVDTGSRLDDYVFEEFKGTGNSEIMLDRSLAETRIFPAISIRASGTRKEELLFTPEELRWLVLLRRKLANEEPAAAMTRLLGLMRSAPDNETLIARMEP